MAADRLELMKVKAELKRVEAAKADQEIHIEEALLQIERLKAAMAIQDARAKELADKIASMEQK